MLSYSILVTSSLLESQNAKSAFLFSKALMHHTKNSIHSIFFYGNGVFNGITTIKEINGMNITDQWHRFSKKFSINLYICATAAQDRGIISSHFEKKNELLQENLHAGFQVVGLGVLVNTILNSDRFLQF